MHSFECEGSNSQGKGKIQVEIHVRGGSAMSVRLAEIMPASHACKLNGISQTG